MNNLQQVELEIKERFRNYPNLKLPIFGNGYSEDDILVEEINVIFRATYFERDQEHLLFETTNGVECFLKLCDKLSFSIAVDYERCNRVNSIDNRIIIFAKHIDILVGFGLNKDWITKIKTKYNKLIGFDLFK